MEVVSGPVGKEHVHFRAPPARRLDGFEGKHTTSTYAKLAKCSQDTALRDILPLVERGILVRNPAAGRSTSYALAWPDRPRDPLASAARTR
jgi:Fic family protein